MRFNYLLEKIKNADFETAPFKHLYIENLFNEADFKEITAAQEIHLNESEDDKELFYNLYQNNYKIIEFPGSVTSEAKYISWHKFKNSDQSVSSACEGFGVVLRLMETKSSIIKELQDFMNSEEFVTTIGAKFGVNPKECNYDAGIQKYLDGYEISPHPDIRRKALTYMVNINPCPTSESEHYHTQYMALNKSRSYVQSFWEGNEKIDRCWVPWDWCETKKTQTKNNSIVIFSPDNSTLHAVKANYNHLAHQRTQMYGNLWHLNYPGRKIQTWEDLDIKSHDYNPVVSARDKIKGLLPEPFVNTLKNLKKSLGKNNRGNREY